MAQPVLLSQMLRGDQPSASREYRGRNVKMETPGRMKKPLAWSLFRYKSA